MVSRLTKLKGILRCAFLFVHSIVRTAMQRVYRLETPEGVGVYEVEDEHFHLGERQCVFKKRHAKKAGTVDFI